MTRLPAGHVAVRLGSIQREAIYEACSPRLNGHDGFGPLLLGLAASDEDGVTMPFTAAASIANILLDVNTDWKGEIRSKRLARTGQILAKSVMDYAKHPAFRMNGTGVIGRHLETVLPIWGESWWPEPDTVHQVLSPRVRTWQGTDFTEWRPRLPLPPTATPTLTVLLEPDFHHLQSFTNHPQGDPK